MAVRNLTQFTTTAQKGLKKFWQAEDGGTGKRTALSMGFLVGGAVMIQHLAAQTADAVHINKCEYLQDCPTTDDCVRSKKQTAQCGTVNQETKRCDPDRSFCD